MKYNCVETHWSLTSKAEFMIAFSCNTSLSIITCLSLKSTAPASPKNVKLNCLQLSVEVLSFLQQSSVHDSFTSDDKKDN